MVNNELYHYGVKGMRWGHRKKEYTNVKKNVKKMSDSELQNYINRSNLERQYYAINNKSDITKVIKPINSALRSMDASMDLYGKITGKRVKDARKIIKSSSRITNSGAKIYSGVKKNKKNDISNMTDDELRSYINRDILEKQYMNAYKERNISNGSRYVNSVLEIAGDVLVVAGSAITIANTVKHMMK